jgi:hypothetical protein
VRIEGQPVGASESRGVKRVSGVRVPSLNQCREEFRSLEEMGDGNRPDSRDATDVQAIAPLALLQFSEMFRSARWPGQRPTPSP